MKREILGIIIVLFLFSSVSAIVEPGWTGPNICRDPSDYHSGFEDGINGGLASSGIPEISFGSFEYADVREHRFGYECDLYPGMCNEESCNQPGGFSAELCTEKGLYYNYPYYWVIGNKVIYTYDEWNEQGSGNPGAIDFNTYSAHYVSVLVSADTDTELLAFDKDYNLIETSGVAGKTTGTNSMTRLTVEAPEIDRVLVRDYETNLYGNMGFTGVVDEICTDGNRQKLQTIHAYTGPGGTISPSGEVPILQGNDQTFTISPNEGNDIYYADVDGTSYEAISTFTFTNVMSDHYIFVYFTGNQPPVAPVADFEATPLSGTAPLKVTFTDKSTGDITSRVWEYKNSSESIWTTFSLDGTSSHTFTNPGVYDVKLTAAADTGDPSTKTITISLTAADLEIFEIKPIQVVWDSDINGGGDNDLVAGKPTAVFVYVNDSVYDGLTDDQLVEIGVQFNLDNKYIQTTVGKLKQDNYVIVSPFWPTDIKTIQITATIDPTNQISEIDETNNEKTVPSTVFETATFTLVYMPINPPPNTYSSFTNSQFMDTFHKSGAFIRDVYPVNPNTLDIISIDPFTGNLRMPRRMEQNLVSEWFHRIILPTTTAHHKP
jgi:PKD repeat protein